VQQRGRDLAPHPLAQRELTHGCVEERLEAEQLDELGQVLAVALGRHAVDVLQEVERVAQRQIPPELRALAEDDADATRELDAVALRIEPRHPDVPRRRDEDAREHLDRRRLPRAVGPDVADDLAAFGAQ
jgi:hypothetical protein